MHKTELFVLEYADLNQSATQMAAQGARSKKAYMTAATYEECVKAAPQLSEGMSLLAIMYVAPTYVSDGVCARIAGAEVDSIMQDIDLPPDTDPA